MMKKFSVIVFSLLICGMNWAKVVTVDGIRYSLSDKTAAVKRGDKNQTNVVIPAQIDYKGIKYTVTSISDKAYSFDEAIKSVTIPHTVTDISDWAFFACRALKTVELEETISLKNIGDYAFGYCASLGSFTIPHSVTTLGEGAFEGCSSLNAITIPDSVTSIKTRTFSECRNLISVTIPNSVTSIGEYAFCQCGRLTSLTIPKAVKNIGDNAFRDCTSQLHLKVLNPAVLIGTNSFGECIVEYPTSSPSTAKIAVVEQQTPSFPKTMLDENIPVTNLVNSTTFAVIIGNENYRKVTTVDYAENDAKVFAQYCEKTLGIPASNVRLYTNVTYGDLLDALDDIKSIAKAYEGNIDLIFYYAGHGVPNETTKDAFIMPVDASGSKTEVCLSISKLYEELASTQANHVTVLLDACFSGAQRGGGMLASTRGIALEAKPCAPQGNMVVLSAATGDQTAYPYKEMNHGMFTYYLLKKLQETKGECSLQELGDYIKTNVSQKSIVENRKSQTPTITPSATLNNNWMNWKLY